MKKFDPVERSLSKSYVFDNSKCLHLSGVAWSLALADEKDANILEDFPPAQNASIAINIYRDVIAIPDERPLPPNITNILEGFTPADAGFGLRIDNETAIPIAVLGQHTWDDVTTVMLHYGSKLPPLTLARISTLPKRYPIVHGNNHFLRVCTATICAGSILNHPRSI